MAKEWHELSAPAVMLEDPTEMVAAAAPLKCMEARWVLSQSVPRSRSMPDGRGSVMRELWKETPSASWMGADGSELSER